MPAFLRLRLGVTGLAEVREFLVEVRENADDLSPALTVVAENLRAYQREVFNTGGRRALGAVWDGLPRRTVTARRNRTGHYARPPRGEGPARRVLNWTHALRDSLTQEGAEGSLALISNDGSTLRFGSTIPYSAPVNRRRPFFVFPEDVVVTAMVQPVAQYLLGRDPALGQGRRTSRRVGRLGVLRPVRFDEAAD